MTAIDKVVYAADKIDPLRGYNSEALIDAMKKDIDSGFKIVLKANKEYIEGKGKLFNDILTDQCVKEYLE